MTKTKKGNTKRKNAKFTQQISTTVRDNTKHVGLMIILNTYHIIGIYHYRIQKPVTLSSHF